jgi:hypothetical protein
MNMGNISSGCGGIPTDDSTAGRALDRATKGNAASPRGFPTFVNSRSANLRSDAPFQRSGRNLDCRSWFFLD